MTGLFDMTDALLLSPRESDAAMLERMVSLPTQWTVAGGALDGHSFDPFRLPRSDSSPEIQLLNDSRL